MNAGGYICRDLGMRAQPESQSQQTYAGDSDVRSFKQYRLSA